jgi:serine/threonine protein kinase
MEIDGRLIPEATIWKIVHDVSAGLSHIHSCGIVHHDIKPSNIFFVAHPRFGAMCKIGNLGMAGEVGTCEDGQEGDTMYMALELLASCVKQPCADIFSLGLTLYEMSAGCCGWELPSEGPGWHELQSGSHVPECHQRIIVIW